VRQRLLTLPKKHSFFLLGARNTGKSTLITSQFPAKHSFLIDLLDAEQEAFYQFHPADLYRIVMSLPDHVTHIVIDEIQKAPKLLDSVQRLMKHKKHYFILTGSSARKLKRGGANLLAGRAFVYYLFPFSFLEVEDVFSLNEALRWGTLPEIFALNDDAEKQAFLSGYAHTYLKEEILIEQLIRNIDPFHSFLEVSAQMNGEILNFSKIAREANTNDKSIERYYSILEDTLLGFHLKPYHRSVRKQQISSSKFYYFDTGILRALRGLADHKISESTYEYGKIFESFMIGEIYKLNKYLEKDHKLSFLKTKDGVEIDLIIESSPNKKVCVEIKSGEVKSLNDFNSQYALAKEISNSKLIVLSQNKKAMSNSKIHLFPWQEGLNMIFGAGLKTFGS